MMEPSKLQQQVTQALAEVFNTLQQASFEDARPLQMRVITRQIDAFQEVINGLANGSLIIAEAPIEDPDGGNGETE